MRKLLTVILLVLVAASCRKQFVDKPKDTGLFVPVLLSSQVETYTSQSITFNLDIAICNDSILNTPDSSDIHFYNGSTYRYKILNQEVLGPDSRGNFCTALLVDQSGSYLRKDFNNERFKALNGFYKNILPGDSFILSAYSKGGKLREDMCTVYWNQFVNTYDDGNIKDLLNLASLTGGAPCLFDALYFMTDYMAANGSGNNRSITALVHSQDSVSKHTITEVIANAQGKNVRINIIWLADAGFNPTQLSRIPIQTGGFSVYCFADSNLASVFLNLNKLLRNDMTAQRFRVKFSAEGINFGPGFSLQHVIGVTGFELPCYFYLGL